MELWDLWIALIINAITFLSEQLVITEAMAIIIFTLCVRLLLFPLSFKSAFNMQLNRQAIDKIKPQIDKLKERYKDNPEELARKTIEIYKKKNIKFMDKVSLYNVGLQGTFGIGIFQALKQTLFTSKFFWIENISKPDVILATLVGVLTLCMMLLSPGASDQLPMLIAMAIISTVVLCNFPSAIGIYLATSNIVSCVQTIILRLVISKRNATQMTG